MTESIVLKRVTTLTAELAQGWQPSVAQVAIIRQLFDATDAPTAAERQALVLLTDLIARQLRRA